MKIYIMLLGVFLFTACGYKPSSHAIKEVFTDTIYVDVTVDTVEPENAPFIKDEMNRLVYTRMNARVTSKEEAQSSIYINYKGTMYRPLAYEDGYVTRYRVDTHMNFVMYTKQGVVKKKIRSRVESDIQASSLTSSTLRTEAIRQGLAKSLDEFIAYVSAKGIKISKKNREHTAQ